MKRRSIFLVLFFSMMLLSCGSDDDICLSGEATPRMKLKFKTQSTGKLRTLDSVFVNVDYGSGAVPVITSRIKTDSVLIPLRVDDAVVTDVYIGLSSAAVNSKLKVNYTTKSEYVSPACGIKRVYENLNGQLETPGNVQAIEQNQTQITDEAKTHFFLLF